MPDLTELDALSTDDLRERAVSVALRHADVGFFWSVLRHLGATEDAASSDGSPGEIGGSITELVHSVRELAGNADLGGNEPLLRAKFIDYLRSKG